MHIVANYVQNARDATAIEDIAVDLFYKPYLQKAKGKPDSFLTAISRWTRQPTNGLVIAYEGNDVVGFSMHGPLSAGNRRLYKDAGSDPTLDDREVALIGVRPGLQGNQIGKQLLKATQEEAVSFHAPNLYAVCLEGKAGASYKLFSKQGFGELMTHDGIAYGKPGTIVRKHLA